MAGNRRSARHLSSSSSSLNLSPAPITCLPLLALPSCTEVELTSTSWAQADASQPNLSSSTVLPPVADLPPAELSREEASVVESLRLMELTAQLRAEIAEIKASLDVSNHAPQVFDSMSKRTQELNQVGIDAGSSSPTTPHSCGEEISPTEEVLLNSSIAHQVFEGMPQSNLVSTPALFGPCCVDGRTKLLGEGLGNPSSRSNSSNPLPALVSASNIDHSPPLPADTSIHPPTLPSPIPSQVPAPVSAVEQFPPLPKSTAANHACSSPSAQVGQVTGAKEIAGPAKFSWVQRVTAISKANTSPRGISFEFFEPVKEGDDVFVEAAIEQQEIHPVWGSCLAGYFLGRRPHFKIVEAYARKL